MFSNSRGRAVLLLLCEYWWVIDIYQSTLCLVFIKVLYNRSTWKEPPTSQFVLLGVLFKTGTPSHSRCSKWLCLWLYTFESVHTDTRSIIIPGDAGFSWHSGIICDLCTLKLILFSLGMPTCARVSITWVYLSYCFILSFCLK